MSFIPTMMLINYRNTEFRIVDFGQKFLKKKDVFAMLPVTEHVPRNQSDKELWTMENKLNMIQTIVSTSFVKVVSSLFSHYYSPLCVTFDVQNVIE